MQLLKNKFKGATLFLLAIQSAYALFTYCHPKEEMVNRAMMRVIPSGRLFVSEPDPKWFGNGPNPTNDSSWTNQNWLKSRFHFSFAEYSNPKNTDFGVLRVMNDDLVQPHRGFGTHGHSNMEIVTYIVSGQLTHKDSMGTEESLGRGSIQFMTAGKGVRHSEFNHGDIPLRFIQTWIVPAQHGLTPKYGSYVGGSPETRKNQFQHLVSNVMDTSSSTPVERNQDVDMYATELELGSKAALHIGEGRQAYLLCIEGEISVNNEKQLAKHDACEITTADGAGGELEITGTAVEHTESGDVAHALVFVMKAVPGSERSDF